MIGGKEQMDHRHSSSVIDPMCCAAAVPQGVTLAVWLTMLQVKRSRAQSMADIEALDKNLPWDSEIALQYWSKHWQSVIAEGYDAPSGDTLIRLNFCDVRMFFSFSSTCHSSLSYSYSYSSTACPLLLMCLSLAA